MKKKLYFVLLVTLVAALSIGCSQPAEEVVVTEEAVTLEPEEAIDVSASGQAEEGDEVSEKAVVSETASNMFPAFELKNLEDQRVTEALFTEHDLTLVNIWGTTCGPCIKEMPELEKLQNNYKDQGLNVVGFIVDGNYLAGKEIVDALLLTYDHIVPDRDFYDAYLSKFQFVPTTLFVNNAGEIIGEPIVGAREYEVFEEAVKKYLEID